MQTKENHGYFMLLQYSVGCGNDSRCGVLMWKQIPAAVVCI